MRSAARAFQDIVPVTVTVTVNATDCDCDCDRASDRGRDRDRERDRDYDCPLFCLAGEGHLKDGLVKLHSQPTASCRVSGHFR